MWTSGTTENPSITMGLDRARCSAEVSLKRPYTRFRRRQTRRSRKLQVITIPRPSLLDSGLRIPLTILKILQLQRVDISDEAPENAHRPKASPASTSGVLKHQDIPHGKRSSDARENNSGQWHFTLHAEAYPDFDDRGSPAKAGLPSTMMP